MPRRAAFAATAASAALTATPSCTTTTVVASALAAAPTYRHRKPSAAFAVTGTGKQTVGWSRQENPRPAAELDFKQVAARMGSVHCSAATATAAAELRLYSACLRRTAEQRQGPPP